MDLNPNDPNGHVTFGTFGMDCQNTLLDKTLKESPPVRPTSALQLGLMAYQTDYGLYNHTQPDKERPLALHALHAKENTWEGGPVLSVIRRFHNYQINEMGYSLDSFFNLDYPIAMFIFELAENAILQKTIEQAKVEQSLKKSQ